MFQLIKKNSFLVILLLCFSCTSVKTVEFKTYVDTRDRPINYQVKKTYHLEDLNLYADNLFDGARLNGFEKENDSTVVVVISPENTPINNSAYFAFKTWTSTPGEYYYKFKYPKGYKHRYIPKIQKNGFWHVIDSTHIFKKDSIVTIKLNLGKEPVIVAAQEIQSSSNVNKWIRNLTKGKGDFTKIRSAGKSILGRNIPVMEFSKGNKKGKPIIVFLTRQHPPEITGYFAFKYFIETLVSESPLSNNFLDKFTVLAFPLINPDGVDLGHWRHNAGGVDTNRDWSKYNQPEIKQIVKYISKEIKKNDSKLILGMDFHSTWYDVFYTNKLREGTSLPNFIDDWFNRLESNIENYKVNEVLGSSSKPVSKGWFLGGHNAVGITYEIGDNTPYDKIEIISNTSANEMMKLLVK